MSGDEDEYAQALTQMRMGQRIGLVASLTLFIGFLTLLAQPARLVGLPAASPGITVAAFGAGIALSLVAHRVQNGALAAMMDAVQTVTGRRTTNNKANCSV